MFDTGGSQGRLHACPLLGTWRALFCGKFFLGGARLVTICSVCWRIDKSGFKTFQEWYRRIAYAVRVAVNRFFLRSGWFEMSCQAMGAGRAARGDRKSGADGCREASWSEELDGKELRGALGSKRTLEPRGSPFSGHRLPTLLHRLQCGMLISKCTLIPLYITRLFFSRELCYSRTLGFKNKLRLSNIPVELALAANGVFQGRVVP